MATIQQISLVIPFSRYPQLPQLTNPQLESISEDTHFVVFDIKSENCHFFLIQPSENGQLCENLPCCAFGASQYVACRLFGLPSNKLIKNYRKTRQNCIGNDKVTTISLLWLFGFLLFCLMRTVGGKKSDSQVLGGNKQKYGKSSKTSGKLWSRSHGQLRVNSV